MNYEFEVDSLGEESDNICYVLSSNEKATLTQKGITNIVITKDGRKIFYPYVFNGFEIYSKYRLEDNWYYNGFLNGEYFYGIQQSDIVKEMNKYCGISSKSSLSKVLINEFILQGKIKDITNIYSKVCGYTEHGFLLDRGCVEYPNNDLVRSIRTKIMNKDNSFDDDWRQHMIDNFALLYDEIDFDHKDIVFAYGIVSPFLNALRDRTNIMPLLHLIGDGESGKSFMASIITQTFYGHVESSFSDDISKSRFEAALSSSTFPIVFDDVENLDQSYWSSMKTYTTTKSDFIRHNPNNTIRFKIPYQAPIITTQNYENESFTLDPAFRSRNIVIISSVEGKKKSKEIVGYKNNLEEGFMRKLLIDYMKDKSIDDLIDILDNDIEDFKRSDWIKRLITLGVYLAKQILEIDLHPNYEYLNINTTQENPVLSDVMAQCYYSTINNGIDEFGNDYWKPTGLFKTKVYSINNEFRYTKENLNDLNNILRLPKRLKLTQLYQILKKEWIDVENKVARLGGSTKPDNCIIIPMNHICIIKPKEEIHDCNAIDIDKLLTEKRGSN